MKKNDPIVRWQRRKLTHLEGNPDLTRANTLNEAESTMNLSPGKALALLAAGTIGASAMKGVSVDQLVNAMTSPTYAEEQVQDRGDYKLLERSMRRLDPAIAGMVQQDYTKKSNARVKLRRLSEGMQRAQGNHANASYNPLTNILSILLDEKGKMEPRSLESLSHELWHAIFDNDRVKGLLYDENYAGPDAAKIESFAKARLNDPMFKDILENIETGKYMFMLHNEDKHCRTFGEGYGMIYRKMKALDRMMDEMANVLPMLGKEKSSEMRKKHQELGAEVEALSVKVKEYADWAVNQDWDEINNHPENIKLAYVKPRAEKAQSLRRELTKWRELGKRFQYFRDEALPPLDEVVRNQYETGLAIRENELENAKGEDVKKWEKELDSWKQRLPIYDKLEKWFRKSLTPISSIGPSTMELLRGYALENGVYDTFHNPDEFMARVVASLYSLYDGPVEQSYFPLDEVYLSLLEEFTVGGESIFRKGIDKYRIMLEMKKEGMKFDEATKEKLLDANEWEHKGKYVWEKIDFAIKGEIPPYEFADALEEMIGPPLRLPENK